MTAKALVKFLETIGFSKVRQRGSHAMMRHEDGRRTIIPMHSGDIPVGTLHAILKDISLDASEIK